MFIVITPLIIFLSSCGDKKNNETNDKSNKNTAAITKPSPKLKCDDPLLMNQLQWLIADNVYKPKHLLIDWNEVFQVEVLSEREISRESVDVGNNQKAERLKCEADLNIALVDEQLFVKADKMHSDVKSNGAKGLGLDNSYGRSFTMTYVPTEQEYLKGERSSNKPMPSTVKGNVTYVAALEVNEEQKSKGKYFALSTSFSVRYLDSNKFGDPSFVSALRDADVVMSWLDLNFKPTGANNKNWNEDTKVKFTNACKKWQYQLSQCDCMVNDFQKNFTQQEFAQAEQSAKFIDGVGVSREAEFPFKPINSFPSVYPIVTNYLKSVVEKCGK